MHANVSTKPHQLALDDGHILLWQCLSRIALRVSPHSVQAGNGAQGTNFRWITAMATLGLQQGRRPAGMRHQCSDLALQKIFYFYSDGSDELSECSCVQRARLPRQAGRL